MSKLLNLHMTDRQIELLQQMIDGGLYGTISLPTGKGGKYVLSHVAMNSPVSHVAMNSPVSHIAMNSPVSHVAMNSPVSHVAMNAPVSHVAKNADLKK